jgi:hypothetical protein
MKIIPAILDYIVLKFNFPAMFGLNKAIYSCLVVVVVVVVVVAAAVVALVVVVMAAVVVVVVIT